MLVMLMNPLPPTLTRTSLVQRSKRHLWQELGGESVILDLDAGVYYGLSGVGSRAWSLMETVVRVKTVLERLVAEYEVEPARCEEELMAWLQEMARAGLVEVKGGANGLAR